MRRIHAILLVLLLLAAYGIVGRIEADSREIMSDADIRLARQNIMDSRSH